MLCIYLGRLFWGEGDILAPSYGYCIMWPLTVHNQLTSNGKHHRPVAGPGQIPQTSVSVPAASEPFTTACDF